MLGLSSRVAANNNKRIKLLITASSQGRHCFHCVLSISDRFVCNKLSNNEQSHAISIPARRSTSTFVAATILQSPAALPRRTHHAPAVIDTGHQQLHQLLRNAHTARLSRTMYHTKVPFPAAPSTSRMLTHPATMPKAAISAVPGRRPASRLLATGAHHHAQEAASPPAAAGPQARARTHPTTTTPPAQQPQAADTPRGDLPINPPPIAAAAGTHSIAHYGGALGLSASHVVAAVSAGGQVISVGGSQVSAEDSQVSAGGQVHVVGSQVNASGSHQVNATGGHQVNATGGHQVNATGGHQVNAAKRGPLNLKHCSFMLPKGTDPADYRYSFKNDTADDSGDCWDEYCGQVGFVMSTTSTVWAGQQPPARWKLAAVHEASQHPTNWAAVTAAHDPAASTEAGGALVPGSRTLVGRVCVTPRPPLLFVDDFVIDHDVRGQGYGTAFAKRLRTLVTRKQYGFACLGCTTVALHGVSHAFPFWKKARGLGDFLKGADAYFGVTDLAGGDLPSEEELWDFWTEECGHDEEVVDELMGAWQKREKRVNRATATVRIRAMMLQLA
jgi:hypothetical protein